MSDKKILSYIGISRKAGFCTVGTELTCDAVRSGRVKLVILAADASDNTKKRIVNCCNSYKVKYIVALSCDTIGDITGKHALVSSCGITDDGLSQSIIKSFNSLNTI